MKAKVVCLLVMVLMLLGSAAFGADHPELKAFPPAEPGMERFVITLPPMERKDQDSFKVELTVGKNMLTDGVNLVRLGNRIEAHPLPGWGYTYYSYTEAASTISTMMAPPEGAEMVETFVTAAPLLLRYNSLLPIVVYVPQGYEVRYRIWKASETLNKAIKK